MNSNAYMKDYMIKRYHARMTWAKKKLGNKCKGCGSTDNLELDHINPKSKSFTIGGRLWNKSESEFVREVEKCQLLCKSCHNDKTLKDLGLQNARKVHGTLSSYRYCHCELCREAKRDWLRKYRQTHPRKYK